MARTCWYRRPFRLIYRYQVKEKYEKEWTDTIYFYYFYINFNGKYQRHMAASCRYHLPNIIPSCSTRAIRKSLTLNEKYLSKQPDVPPSTVWSQVNSLLLRTIYIQAQSFNKANKVWTGMHKRLQTFIRVHHWIFATVRCCSDLKLPST